MKLRIQTVKLLILLFSAFSISISAKDIYVSPNGKDNNPGTKNKPLKTIPHVKKIAVEMLESGKQKEVTVWLGDGIYPIVEPLNFQPIKSTGKNIKLVFKA